MEPARSRILSWVPVVLWMVLIFALSSVPDLRSGLQPLWDTILRKCAHAGEYAVLGWLTFRALERSGIRREKALIISFVVGALYAASDELHQTTVGGRHGSALDASLDVWAVALGVLVRFRIK